MYLPLQINKLLLAFSFLILALLQSNIDAVMNDGSNDRHIIKNCPLPNGSSIELIQGKVVIPSGGSIKVKSSDSLGNADVIDFHF